MTDEQIKYMVSRFLRWKVPNDFSPDGGIHFNPKQVFRPVGTNILNTDQAEAMVRYIVEGME